MAKTLADVALYFLNDDREKKLKTELRMNSNQNKTMNLQVSRKGEEKDRQ